MKRNGFTLIEILVVLGVMTIVGALLVETFIRSLFGGNKAEVINQIKQNGQTILETMDKTIRSSDNVICPPVIPPSTQASSAVLAMVREGVYTRYRFVNDQLLEDHPVLGTDIKQSQFLLDICTNVGYVGATASNITNTNLVTILNPTSGQIFTRGKSAGFKDVVTINFLIKAGTSIPRNVADQIDPVPFTTTIQLR